VARLALIVALFALPCAAASEDPSPPAMSFIVPALETEALHLGMLSFSNLVTHGEFAQISLDSIASHFDGRRPWVWDDDRFLTNQFGHPLQGAFTFTAARGAGLGFAWASVYTFISSLTWELFYEVDNPSINDQITTTLGGIVLGEVLHRTALLIFREDQTEPRIAGRLTSFFLDPFGGLNRWLLPEEIDESRPRYFGLVSLGVGVQSYLRDAAIGPLQSDGVQVQSQVLLSYWASGDRRPLSHFDLSATVSPGELPASTLFIRGVLYGTWWGPWIVGIRGVWGIFGQYDFAQPTLARVSTTGVGPGTMLEWRASTHVFLQATGVISFVPFGSIGSLGLNEAEFRDYHIGPGAQATLELRLIHTEAGMIRLVAQQWLVVGAYVPPSGIESMTYLTASLVVKLGWRIGAMVDLGAMYRLPRFEDDTFNRAVRGTTARFSLCYLTDENFGLR
jgi:hypothetical protein